MFDQVLLNVHIKLLYVVLCKPHRVTPQLTFPVNLVTITIPVRITLFGEPWHNLFTVDVMESHIKPSRHLFSNAVNVPIDCANCIFFVVCVVATVLELSTVDEEINLPLFCIAVTVRFCSVYHSAKTGVRCFVNLTACHDQSLKL
ncbi:MAG: hypothetical protein [Caudoviricetes sp.]|nr:MAG: hypothetical protein [Caudoviricetes sp.]